MDDIISFESFRDIVKNECPLAKVVDSYNHPVYTVYGWNLFINYDYGNGLCDVYYRKGGQVASEVSLDVALLIFITNEDLSSDSLTYGDVVNYGNRKFKAVGISGEHVTIQEYSDYKGLYGKIIKVPLNVLEVAQWVK